MSAETHEYSEQELIEGIKVRDQAVVRAFVEQFQNKIFRLCMQYMHSEDEAYDMVQEVFMVILDKIHGFRGDSKLSTWIYSITVFTCIGHLRKKKKKNESSFEDFSQNYQNPEDYLTSKWVHQNFAENHNPLENELLKKEAMDVLLKEIHDLPYDYRTIFILKELEGMSIKEIQETVPISVSAIKTRLHRARIYLRNKLAQYFNDFNPESQESA